MVLTVAANLFFRVRGPWTPDRARTGSGPDTHHSSSTRSCTNVVLHPVLTLMSPTESRKNVHTPLNKVGEKEGPRRLNSRRVVLINCPYEATLQSARERHVLGKPLCQCLMTPPQLSLPLLVPNPLSLSVVPALQNSRPSWCASRTPIKKLSNSHCVSLGTHTV